MPPIVGIPIVRQTIFAGDSPYLMSRLLNASGNYVVNADMSGGTITAKVFDLYSTAPANPTATINLSPISTYLFDTIQLPAVPAGNIGIWDADTVGFNFSYALPSQYTKTTETNDGGPGEIRVEIWATPAAGQPFRVGVWQFLLLQSLSYS